MTRFFNCLNASTAQLTVPPDILASNHAHHAFSAPSPHLQAEEIRNNPQADEAVKIHLDLLERTLEQQPLNFHCSSSHQKNVEDALIVLTNTLEKISNASNQKIATQLIRKYISHIGERPRLQIKFIAENILNAEIISEQLQDNIKMLLDKPRLTLGDYLKEPKGTIQPVISAVETQVEEIISHPFTPTYRRGSKIRLFESQQWRNIKTDIKKTYITTQWKQFLNTVNPEISRDHVKQQMQDTLSKVQTHSKLRKKAEKYIEKKSKTSQYFYNQDTKTGIFRAKGTDLGSSVYRTENNNFYKVIRSVTKELREMISTQQNKRYLGSTYLGTGTSATVRLAEQFDGKNKTIVAAKISNMESIFENKERKLMLQDEKELLDKLPRNEQPGSQYFSSIRDLALIQKPGKAPKSALLFLDLEARGNLASLIRKIKHIPEKNKKGTIQTLARQLVESIQVMHSNHVFHQDIKPENVLISKKGTLVLTDFGTASGENKQAHHSWAMGTAGYIAPEASQPGALRSKGDTYALGQVLLDLHRAAPNHSKELFEIAKTLINPKPNKRPDLSEILHKKYMQTPVFTNDKLLTVIDS